MKTVRARKNPVIPGLGVCDPHVHIFQDKAYLYASHDQSPANLDYAMVDWQIWSSPDLVRWSLESTFRPEDSYIGPSSSCWATDAAQRDGKFFFYFSNGVHDTGVAVSEHPGGPFRDALNAPLLPEGQTPTRPYDPAVFVDDDPAHTPYIVFGTPVWAGGDSYYIARLNEDMLSLAETPRKLILDDGADDKPFLHKHNGLYYLSWASFYAVSQEVYGPYRLVGNIGASPDHGSYFEWNGQWFHAFTVLDPSLTYRATGLCYIHYRANAEMVADSLIVEYGVGQYDARWTKIEAEWFMAAAGVEKRENPRRGFDVAALRDGASLSFPNIQHLPENAHISFYAASHHPHQPAGVEIEIHQDTPDGPLLGRCPVPETGSWDWFGYRSLLCELRNPPGTTHLVFVFRGAAPDLLHLDWFKFY